MSDIIERLREHAEIHEAHMPHDDEQRLWADDLRKAADEIDRLRAALWQCFTDAGGDTDGKADAAGISTDDLISTTTDCVKDLRLGYDEMGESNRCMRAALRAMSALMPSAQGASNAGIHRAAEGRPVE